MKKLFIFLLMAIMILVNACSHEKSNPKKNILNRKISKKFVFVEGGTFVDKKSKYYGKNIKLRDFYIGKYEISQEEWFDVMDNNPSEFKDADFNVKMASNSSDFKGKRFPVETVSWYDCIDYCNKRSLKEHLKPYYNIDDSKFDPHNTSDKDNLKWIVTINKKANGYRIPTELEWEYAASGGQLSKSYTYSGSNDGNKVAWNWKNSGDKKLGGFWSKISVKNNNNKPQLIGSKKPNELGLYDMSGNVREWCWDWYGGTTENKSNRVWRGGGWLGNLDCCKTSYRGSWAPNQKGNDTGFRVCRGL